MALVVAKYSRMPDDNNFPEKPMIKSALSLPVLGVFLAFGSSLAIAAPDWSKVPKREVPVFHAGVNSIEWMTNKSDHSGSVGLRKGESCAGCHEENGKLNFDFKRLASKELEPVGAPKTMQFPVAVQAAFDTENLYMRLTFKAPADAAAKADREEKSPLHDVKVAVMFAGPKVPQGSGDRLLGNLPQRRSLDAWRRPEEKEIREGRQCCRRRVYGLFPVEEWRSRPGCHAA